MGRTLIRIPRMYLRNELLRVNRNVPFDFDDKEEEFWTYVGEKLRKFENRIKRIYQEYICVEGEEALESLDTKSNRNHALVFELAKKGAKIEASEDSTLVLECESWADMIERQPNSSLLELFEGCMKERDEQLSKKIDQTLLDGEIGVAIFESSRKISLPDDVKIVKMAPFDPKDYLNSWLTQLRLQAGKGSRRNSKVSSSQNTGPSKD